MWVVVAFLILSLLGVGSFFVLPANLAPIGWITFAIAVLGMLVTIAIIKGGP